MKLLNQAMDSDDSYFANYFQYDELKTYEQIKTFINSIGKQWEITNISLEYYNDHDTFNPTLYYENLADFNEKCNYFPNEEDLELVIFDMKRGNKIMSGRISTGQNVFYTYEDKNTHNRAI